VGMAFERTKLLISFALLGFLVGTASYFFFNWLLVNSAIQLPPLVEVLFSPWFFSGITGSILSVLIVTVFAHLTKEE